jgi:hypothetical protein
MRAFEFCKKNYKVLNISEIEREAGLCQNTLLVAVKRGQKNFKKDKKIAVALDKLLPSWRFQ